MSSYVAVRLAGSAERATELIDRLRQGVRDPEVWFPGREGEGMGLLERLKDALGDDLDVVMSDELLDRLRGEIEGGDAGDLEIHDVRPVRVAALPFTVKSFDRETASQLEMLLRSDLPEGVRLEGYEWDETVDPSAEGVELYSPTHDYVREGSGRYVGDVGGVIEMAHRLDEREFVHPKALEIDG